VAAVSNYGYALKHASKKMRDNIRVCLAAIQNDWVAFENVSMRLRDNEHVCSAAVHKHGRAFIYVSPRLQADREFCLKNIAGFVHFSDQFRDDKQLCLLAMQRSWANYFYVSDDMRQNIEVCNAALREDDMVLDYIPEETKLHLLKNMLTTSKLSLLNAHVGLEYELPDEIIEKICGEVCSIDTIKGSYKWKFDLFKHGFFDSDKEI
jgi:hypothetical protein